VPFLVGEGLKLLGHIVFFAIVGFSVRIIKMVFMALVRAINEGLSKLDQASGTADEVLNLNAFRAITNRASAGIAYSFLLLSEFCHVRKRKP